MVVTHIPVKIIETSSYSIKEDSYELTCDHEFAEVEAPCCSTVGSSGYIECGCGGNYSVYCSDCDNEDLTDLEADSLIEAFSEARYERAY